MDQLLCIAKRTDIVTIIIIIYSALTVRYNIYTVMKNGFTRIHLINSMNQAHEIKQVCASILLAKQHDCFFVVDEIR